jgi:hypothetical protein
MAPSGLDKFVKKVKDNFANPKPGSILYNRYLLYIVFFIAVSNLFLATFQRDYLFSVYFILIAFVISFFNKNFIVILVLSIAFANILRFATVSGQEGLENMTESIDDSIVPADVDSPDTLSVPPAKKDDKKSSTASTDSKPKDAKDGKNKSELVDHIKKDAEELIQAQKQILTGFEKIDPYMQKAETLIKDIDATAHKIENFNTQTQQGFRSS